MYNSWQIRRCIDIKWAKHRCRRVFTIYLVNFEILRLKLAEIHHLNRSVHRNKLQTSSKVMEDIYFTTFWCFKWTLVEKLWGQWPPWALVTSPNFSINGIRYPSIPIPPNKPPWGHLLDRLGRYIIVEIHGLEGIQLVVSAQLKNISQKWESSPNRGENIK